jgi:phosphatidylserine decarboxylase
VLKLAPEGYPFIGVFFALTVLAVFAFGPRWAVIPLCLALFMVYFFRDPDRAIPVEEGFLSPADGKVISIGKEHEGEFLKRGVLKISIFMSPIDVHVNRSPCRGEVAGVKHTPGSFRAAFREDASLKNENTAMLLNCDEGPILVRQVAGFLARRTVCRVKPGDALDRGERYGMIKFSSRLDVYLPEDAGAKVSLNDRVRAGETILAVAPERT